MDIHAAPATTTIVAATAAIIKPRLPPPEVPAAGTAVGRGALSAGRLIDAAPARVASAAATMVAAPRSIIVASDCAALPSITSRIACRNSAAVWKRRSGLLAIAFFTTASHAGGRVALSIEGASGSSFNTLCMMVVTAPVNGFSPVRNWYRMTPQENRSLRPSTVWPRNCSGDM